MMVCERKKAHFSWFWKNEFPYRMSKLPVMLFAVFMERESFNTEKEIFIRPV
jgi:hypothetical protein